MGIALLDQSAKQLIHTKLEYAQVIPVTPFFNLVHVGNTVWLEVVRKPGLEDFRFHDLRHTWASWHRQAGTSCDELKDLSGWKSRVTVDRYAKLTTEHLAAAASRIEGSRAGDNVVFLSRFPHGVKNKKGLATR